MFWSNACLILPIKGGVPLVFPVLGSKKGTLKKGLVNSRVFMIFARQGAKAPSRAQRTLQEEPEFLTTQLKRGFQGGGEFLVLRFFHWWLAILRTP